MNKSELMDGKKNVDILLKNLKPKLHEGDYVYCTTNERIQPEDTDIIFHFKEEEGTTVVLKKEVADKLQLDYHFVASWITLTIHSSLEAVGLTSAFSKALSDMNISCNVVAGYYHDHIFVNKKDAENAVKILNSFSEDNQNA